MDWIDKKSDIQKVHLPEISNEFQIYMLREDLLHPTISGNKYRKLKYNVLKANELGCDTILTFGGAFSNHIAAVAAAGHLYDLKTVGLIRGHELKDHFLENPTLKFAHENGMKLHFVTREAYREKEKSLEIQSIFAEYQNAFVVPEGGTNDLAVIGCMEILDQRTDQFDTICVACGTAGTISGLISSAKNNQKILGFPALKGGDFLNETIKTFTQRSNYELINYFHFGGYGKINKELVNFANTFYELNKFPLDPIYTAKMVWGIKEMIKNKMLSIDNKILMLHTGGLQGISGINKQLEQKNELKWLV